MKCKICKDEVTCSCLCGFCYDCIRKHGHGGCTVILQQDAPSDREQIKKELDKDFALTVKEAQDG